MELAQYIGTQEMLCLRRAGFRLGRASEARGPGAAARDPGGGVAAAKAQSSCASGPHGYRRTKPSPIDAPRLSAAATAGAGACARRLGRVGQGISAEGRGGREGNGVADGGAAVRTGVAGTDAGPAGLHSSSPAAAAAARTWGGAESAAVGVEEWGNGTGAARLAGRAGAGGAGEEGDWLAAAAAGWVDVRHVARRRDERRRAARVVRLPCRHAHDAGFSDVRIQLFSHSRRANYSSLETKQKSASMLFNQSLPRHACRAPES